MVLPVDGEDRFFQQCLFASIGISGLTGGVLTFYSLLIRQCQHRWTPIANMVAFANAVGTNGLTNVKTSGNNQLAYGRGESPFISIIPFGDWDVDLNNNILVV